MRGEGVEGAEGAEKGHTERRGRRARRAWPPSLSSPPEPFRSSFRPLLIAPQNSFRLTLLHCRSMRRMDVKRRRGARGGGEGGGGEGGEGGGGGKGGGRGGLEKSYHPT